MTAVVRERLDAELAQVAFQVPPRVELGDLALTAPFDLAKSLRRKPRAQYEWDGVAEVRPFGAMEKTIVEGVY